MSIRMVWIGVDPGLAGAVAVVFPDREPIAMPMPVVDSAKGGRPTYDLQEIVRLLRSAHGTGSPFLTLEKLQPMPMEQGGTIANYNRGRAMAIFEMAAAALKIPYQLVSPRTWQAVFHAGTSGTDLKQRSIVAAQRLFPGVSLKRSERCRKLDDGMAEALLIAEWGRRVHTPAAVA